MFRIFTSLFILFLVPSLSIGSRNQTKPSKGVARVLLNINGNVGRVEFKLHSGDLLGFEKIAKRDGEKRILADTLGLIRITVAQTIKFDQSIDCVFQENFLDQVRVQFYKNLSEIYGNFDFKCSTLKSFETINLDFSQFKKIKTIDLSLTINGIEKQFQSDLSKKVFQLK